MELYNNSTIYVPTKYKLIIITNENILRYRDGHYKTYLDTKCTKHLFLLKPKTKIIYYSKSKEYELINNTLKYKKYNLINIGIINSLFINKI